MFAYIKENYKRKDVRLSKLDNTFVEGLPFTTNDVVPLGFKATTAGTYTLSIDHVDGLFGGAQDIFIKDNVLQTVHNIKNSAYNFTTEAGTFNNRFEIVYTAMLDTKDVSFASNQVVVYSQNGEMVIHSGAAVMDSVKVLDIQGRVLLEKKGIHSNETKIGNGLSNQVVLLQITSADGAVVTKKVIR